MLSALVLGDDHWDTTPERCRSIMVAAHKVDSFMGINARFLLNNFDMPGAAHGDEYGEYT